jgi:hypothetical protein
LKIVELYPFPFGVLPFDRGRVKRNTMDERGFGGVAKASLFYKPSIAVRLTVNGVNVGR